MRIRDIMRKAQGYKPVTITRIKGLTNTVTLRFSGKVKINPKQWVFSNC